MEITDVDAIPYSIPNRYQHEISTGTLSALDNVLVVIETDEGVRGVGEAVCGPKWNQNPVHAETELIAESLAPPLIGMDPMNVSAIWDAMDDVANAQFSAKAGIDVALHDLIGKALDVPVWSYLGGARRRTIPVEGPGFGIGFMPPAEAAEYALEAVEGGCRQLEVKCGRPSGPADDLAAIEAVHEAAGADVSIKVDVTEGYDFKTAVRTLPEMADLGVDLIEQPLPRHRITELARLRETISVPIQVDETVGHPADVLRVAEAGAADAIHLKYPMLGGFTMCRKIAAICEAAGIAIQGGTATPSGVGLAAVHAFTSTLPTLSHGCHGSALGRAVADIVVDPTPASTPAIEISDAPGIGVEVDWDAVEKYRVDT